MFTNMIADVRFKRLYTCCKCQVKGVGDTETVEVHLRSPVDLSSALDNMPVQGRYMPTGWASFLYGVVCPKCQ